MKKIIRISLFTILILSIAGFIAAIYVGVFYTPVVRETLIGPYTFVYETYKGSYQGTGSVFENLENRLKADSIKYISGIGIYYDDPLHVQSDSLRSDCGYILDRASENTEKLKGKYNIARVGKQKCIMADFPLKNQLSYMIAPMKCYPKLSAYLTSKGLKAGTAIELYDVKTETIHIAMIIAE